MEKAVFVVVSTIVAGIVVAVHVQQVYDRQKMHEGVIRDKERLANKRNPQS